MAARDEVVCIVTRSTAHFLLGSYPAYGTCRAVRGSRTPLCIHREMVTHTAMSSELTALAFSRAAREEYAYYRYCTANSKPTALALFSRAAREEYVKYQYCTANGPTYSGSVRSMHVICHVRMCPLTK